MEVNGQRSPCPIQMFRLSWVTEHQVLQVGRKEKEKKKKACCTSVHLTMDVKDWKLKKRREVFMTEYQVLQMGGGEHVVPLCVWPWVSKIGNQRREGKFPWLFWSGGKIFPRALLQSLGRHLKTGCSHGCAAFPCKGDPNFPQDSTKRKTS